MPQFKKALLLGLLGLSLGCSSLKKTSSEPPYRVVGGFKIYKMVIDGQSVEMVVDADSETTVITPELREKLKIDLLDVEEAQTSANKKVWVDIVSLKDIQVGERKINLFPVLVLDLKSRHLIYGAVDGILGKDFIQRSKELAAH